MSSIIFSIAGSVVGALLVGATGFCIITGACGAGVLMVVFPWGRASKAAKRAFRAFSCAVSACMVAAAVGSVVVGCCAG